MHVGGVELRKVGLRGGEAKLALSLDVDVVNQVIRHGAELRGLYWDRGGG